MRTGFKSLLQLAMGFLLLLGFSAKAQLNYQLEVYEVSTTIGDCDPLLGLGASDPAWRWTGSDITNECFRTSCNGCTVGMSRILFNENYSCYTQIPSSIDVTFKACEDDGAGCANGTFIGVCDGGSALTTTTFSLPTTVGTHNLSTITISGAGCAGNWSYKARWIVSGSNLNPSNDGFCNNQSVILNSTGTTSVYGSNKCSGIQSNEIDAIDPNISPSNTVWYSFVADRKSMRISTNNQGTDFDTELAVYQLNNSTSACFRIFAFWQNLTEVGSNDNISPGNSYSQIDLECMNIGETYFVQVDGNQSNDTGQFTLTFSDLDTVHTTQTFQSCDAYNWPVNSVDYFQSGIYHDTLISSSGCDSILRLDYTREGVRLEKELLPFIFSNGAAIEYGHSVSINQDFAIVGAPSTGLYGPNSGAAYIYRRTSNGQWTRDASLSPSSGVADANFGFSVAIHGSHALVGAPGDRSGAVYFFERDTNGVWSEIAEFRHGNDSLSQFGYSVALNENEALVGVPWERTGYDEPGISFSQITGGAVFYKRNNYGTWNVSQWIYPNGLSAYDFFGVSVSLGEDYAVIGSDGSDNSGSNSGACYVYEKNNSGNWVNNDVIRASDRSAQDRFGRAVGVSGNRIVVGSPFDDDHGTESGSVYIFENVSGTWNEVQKLTASNASANANFGTSLAVDGVHIIAGSHKDDGNILVEGQGYLFERNSTGNWNEIETIELGSPVANHNFFNSVSLDRGIAIVGSPKDVQSNQPTGSVQVYSLPSVSDTAFVNVCANSYLWGVNGNTYTQSGVYVESHNSINGCDSNYVLDLTINPVYESVLDTVQSCNEYFWTRTGRTLYLTGVYYDHLLTVSGCDSLVGIYFERKDAREANKLYASDASVDDGFGKAIGTHGDFVIVGALDNDDDGSSSGSAYIYEKGISGQWNEVQKITSLDGAPNDKFGIAVDIHDSYAVVGATGDDDNGSESGSVYVFKRLASGDWIQVSKITASDGAADDQFGFSVSIGNEGIIVGAFNDDDNGASSGSAYIYERTSSGNWIEKQKLVPISGMAYDWFGTDVHISGAYAIVGANGDDTDGLGTGAAYIYEKNNSGNWVEIEKLRASDPQSNKNFGRSVSLQGDNVIVGANGDNDNGQASGSAYIFKKNSNGQWLEVDKIIASDGDENDWFGLSVDIVYGIALVGAPYQNSNGHFAGAAYVYSRTPSGKWEEIHVIKASDGAAYDYLGWASALNSDFIFLGSGGSDHRGANSGSVYLYVLPSTQDTISVSAYNSYLWEATGQIYNQSGLYVDSAISRQGCDSIVFLDLSIDSAYISIIDSVSECSYYTWPQNGQTYYTSGIYYDTVAKNTSVDTLIGLYFERPQQREVASLFASDWAAGDGTGISVAIDGQYAIVGAYQDDDNGLNSGSAYIYELSSSNQWLEVQKLTASDGSAGDLFGVAVSISGNLAIVTAQEDDDNGSNSGSAYIFERNSSGQWVEVAKISASDGAVDDLFGFSTSIHGQLAAVGSWSIDHVGVNSGSVYIFEENASGQWVEVEKIISSDAEAFDYFGTSLALEGNRIVIGATNDRVNTVNSGSASVFKRDALGQWMEEGKLTPSDGGGSDYFGRSVDISGNRIVVGANRNDDNGLGSGSAYVFELDSTGSWIQTDKILASDGEADDNFGRSVAINNKFIAIGTSGNDILGSNSGATYLYEYSSAQEWLEIGKLSHSNGSSNERFGLVISIDNQHLLVGAYNAYHPGSQTRVGGSFLFSLTNTNDTAVMEVCDSYTWPINGQTYYSSGFYSEVYTSSQRCDSIYSLDLTVLISDSSHIGYSSCTSFTLYDSTYTHSVSWVDSLLNVKGCDSLVSTSIDIFSDTNLILDSIIACQSYLWEVNDQVYFHSGWLGDTVAGVNGCDSITSQYLLISDVISIDSIVAVNHNFGVYQTYFSPPNTTGPFRLEWKTANENSWKSKPIFGPHLGNQRFNLTPSFDADLQVRIVEQVNGQWEIGCDTSIYVPCKDMIIQTAEVNQPVCEGDSALVRVGFAGGMGTKSILWSNGATTKFTYAQQGEKLYVTVSDIAGCSLTDSITGTALNTATAPVNMTSRRSGSLVTASWSPPTLGTGQTVIGYRVNYRIRNTVTWNISPLTTDTFIVIDMSSHPGGNYHFAAVSRYRDNGTPTTSNRSCFALRGWPGIGSKNGNSSSSMSDLDEVVSIYPNPVSYKLYVKAPEGARIQLTNMQGKILADQRTGSEEVIFDMSNLAQAVYLVKVTTDTNSFTEQVVKH